MSSERPNTDGVYRAFLDEIEGISHQYPVEHLDRIHDQVQMAERTIGPHSIFDHMRSELVGQYLHWRSLDRALDLIDEIESPVPLMESWKKICDSEGLEATTWVNIGVRIALAQEDPTDEREVLLRLADWVYESGDRTLGNTITAQAERAHQVWRRAARSAAAPLQSRPGH